MKRFLLPVILVLAVCACTKDHYDYKTEIEAIKAQLSNQRALIDVLQKAVTVTDIKKGEGYFTITFSNGQTFKITDGYTPLISIGENGNWFINGEDTGQPSKGTDGKDGKDGTNYKIEIGSDGYWYINGQNTGVKAAGKDGKDGVDGKDGKDGTDGVDGKNGKDGKDGEDGTDGKNGKDGKDGVPPTVAIGSDGYWYINGVNTGVKAEGQDGSDGKDAVTPRVEIGSNGNWYINGKDTGAKAVAYDGQDGTDAPYITSIVENYATLTFLFSDGTSIDVTKDPFAYISSERISATLAATASIALKENYIHSRNLLTAAIGFDSFSDVQIGRGLKKNGGWLVEISSTQVTVHKYVDSDSVVETFAHGLTLSKSLYVTVDADWGGAVISLYSGGKEFRTESSWDAGGAPFVYNVGGGEVSVDLSFFPYDVSSSVWVIGDDLSAGWTAKIHSDGPSPLVDRRNGGTASQMLTSFKSDLNFGNPAYALWTPGYYNGADGTEVNASWQKATESFLELCKLRGITPILATVPSSSGKDHSLKSEWVRNSGCRFVDFESIDPSDAGARAYRVLVDLPEIVQSK